MAIKSGSPSYPPWRTLTGSWRSYSQAWRTMGNAVLVAALASTGVSGQSIFAVEAIQPHEVAASIGTPASGRLVPAPVSLFTWGEFRRPWRWYSLPWRAYGRSGQFGAHIGTNASGSTAVSVAGGHASISLAMQASGGISAISVAQGSMVLTSDVDGGWRLRISSLPPGRVSLGRLMWQT